MTMTEIQGLRGKLTKLENIEVLIDQLLEIHGYENDYEEELFDKIQSLLVEIGINLQKKLHKEEKKLIKK